MATDVKVVRLYVSSFANGTLDDTPNEVGGNPHTPFHLMLQADASDPAGDNGADYRLIISAQATSGGATKFVPRILNEEAGDPKADWKRVAGNNNGYVKRSTYTVDAGDFDPNGLYEFIAVLRMRDGSVSTVRSDEFFIG